jgi:hypothetical protein
VGYVEVIRGKGTLQSSLASHITTILCVITDIPQQQLLSEHIRKGTEDFSKSSKLA